MYIYMCNIYITYKSHGSSIMKCTLSPLLSWPGLGALFVSSHSILQRIKKKINSFLVIFWCHGNNFQKWETKDHSYNMNFLRAMAGFVIFASTCFFRRV